MDGTSSPRPHDKAVLPASACAAAAALWRRAAPDAAARAASHLPLERLPSFAVVAGYRPIGAEIDPGPLLRRLADRAAPSSPCRSFRPCPASLRFERADGSGAATPELDPRSRCWLSIAPAGAWARAAATTTARSQQLQRPRAGVRHRPRLSPARRSPPCPREPHDQRLDAILTEMGYSRGPKGPLHAFCLLRRHRRPLRPRGSGRTSAAPAPAPRLWSSSSSTPRTPRPVSASPKPPRASCSRPAPTA